MRCKNCKAKCIEVQYQHGIENMHTDGQGNTWRWCKPPKKEKK